MVNMGHIMAVDTISFTGHIMAVDRRFYMVCFKFFLISTVT